MRTWGRVANPVRGAQIGIDFAIGESAIGEAVKPLVWVEVDTDADGFDDAVWLTTLIQVLKLNLGESPFYANYGIPAKDSVESQVAPDAYVARTQQQFASHFANLSVFRTFTIDRVQNPDPVYRVNVITESGSRIAVEIPV